MSDIKFSCPQCQQHIQCDEESYGGTEIACPTCGARMIVPRSAAPPPATAGTSGVRLQSRPGPPQPAATRPTAFRPATARAPAVGSTHWLKSPYPYLGVLAAGFGTLYFFARQNESALLVFALTLLLYSLVVHIIVVVHAFRNEGVGIGLCTLCIPIYAIYYVFFKSESPLLQMLYGLLILLYIGSYTFTSSLESLE